jgi:hypothetical protein
MHLSRVAILRHPKPCRQFGGNIRGQFGCKGENKRLSAGMPGPARAQNKGQTGRCVTLIENAKLHQGTPPIHGEGNALIAQLLKRAKLVDATGCDL